MKRYSVFFAVLLLSLPLLVKAQAVETNAEQAAVRQAVESYINKTNQNVYAPDAKIISVDGMGKRLVETPLGKAYRPKNGETTGESSQRIVEMDLTEGGAFVNVETFFSANQNPVITPRQHIQYVSLLKIGEEWKIVGILMPPLKFESTATK